MSESGVGMLAAGEHFHNPAANTIATKTLAARTGRRWVLGGVMFGFDTTPTSVDFSIECPTATNIFEIPIGVAGVQNIDFKPPLKMPAGAAVTLTLPAGGTGITGWVAFKSVWVE